MSKEFKQWDWVIVKETGESARITDCNFRNSTGDLPYVLRLKSGRGLAVHESAIDHDTDKLTVTGALTEIENYVEEQREHGETDLRCILHAIRVLQKKVKEQNE